MNQIIEGLCELMVQQRDIQSSLLSLAEEKREAVVKNDTDTLSEIVRNEYLRLSQINKVEKLRIELLAGASDAVGKPARQITVSDMIALADGEQRDRLSELQAELLSVIRRLKAQNEENKALIQMQLDYTDTMLNAIAGTEDPLNNFYGTDGQSRGAEIMRGSSLLDTEI